METKIETRNRESGREQKPKGKLETWTVYYDVEVVSGTEKRCILHES